MLEETHSTLPESCRERLDKQSRVAVLIVAGSLSNEIVPERLAVLGERLLLGRSRSHFSHLRLESELVSREHAQIARIDGSYWVTDLGSRNGTWIDGQLASSERIRLTNGSLLYVGGYVLSFRVVTPESLNALRLEIASPFGGLSTRSPCLARVTSQMRLMARVGDVLILGETGTGKDVYARAMHRESQRTGPFVAINCASIPRELVESELFGYVKGAHSQAGSSKRGLLHEAASGTVFLDEIGEMPPESQAKLLRFLQSREITPLGSNTTIRIDTHVIAATNRDMDGDRIRPDLRHRLGDPLKLPPLRKRREDVPLLLQRFLGRGPTFTVGALQALLLHSWPGNVRELEHCVKRAFLLSGGETAQVCHLPSSIVGHVSISEEDLGTSAPTVRGADHTSGKDVVGRGRRKWRPRPKREQLATLLGEHEGNVAAVARTLGRRWQVVWKWLKADEIDPQQFRNEHRRAGKPPA